MLGPIAGTDQTAALVEHREFIGRVVGSVLRRVRSPSLERDDLESVASMAVLECLEKFDPARGATFETYAWSRVRGSVFDEIRRSMPLSRTAWKAVKDGTANFRQVSLDDTEELHALTTAPRDPIAAKVINGALHDLPPRLARVVKLLYVAGMDRRDVAKQLQISPGRVSQLHTRAIERLRMTAVPATASASSTKPLSRRERTRPTADERIASMANRITSLERLIYAMRREIQQLRRGREDTRQHEGMLSINAGAQLAGVSRRTIYNWIEQGRVRAVRTAGGSIRVHPQSLLLIDAERSACTRPASED